MQEEILTTENNTAALEPESSTADKTGIADEKNESAYAPKGIAKAFNKFFKFKERGSTMKREIFAGLSMFFISICVLLMNTRIVCETLGSNGAGYAGTYLAATIISFVGTMLIGFICNLPLVQVSSLGLSTAFISLLGAKNGLTYYNLLAVSFISAIVYATIMAIPASRKFITAALPSPVRKALPVGMGLYIIAYALSSSGILSVNGTNVSALSFSSLAPLGIVAVVASCVTALAIVIFKKIKLAHPYLFGFLSGVLVFYLLGVAVAFNGLFSVNRAYIALGAENMYTIALGFSGLEFGAVFTKGFDFSAYTGNVFTLFAGGILTYFFMGMYESESAIGATELSGADCSSMRGRALLVNAAVNVAAPLFGSQPISIGKQSAIGAGDGGRTGLASVVCGIGYALMAFTWLLFALFATYTASVSEYGHATSNSFAEYAQAGFMISAFAMLVLGTFMLKGVKDCNCEDISEFVPFAATAALTAFTQNVVIGTAVGVIAYVILKLFSFNKQTIKGIGLPTGVLSVILLLALILT